jgi:predicted membrane protein
MDFENRRDAEKEIRRQWKKKRRQFREDFKLAHYQSGRGHIWTGVIILLVGIAALLKAMVFGIPAWVYTWQMLVIIIGFFSGIKHKFRGAFWFIMMTVGGVCLVDEFFPDLMMRKYLWPSALILLGLFFILRPKHKNFVMNPDPSNPKNDEEETPFEKQQLHEDDFVDTTSVFGGVKKNIVSKNFRGGDIVNIFGGSEIDLTQADINGSVRLELTQVFGGTKLIVPANWQIKTEMAAIFGGIEDKRSVQNAAPASDKLLILTGTSIFAGIDIRSY